MVKKLLVLIMLLSFAGFGMIAYGTVNTVTTESSIQLQNDNIKEEGLKFIDYMKSGDYQSAEGMFDTPLKMFVGEDKFKGLWKGLTDTYGEPKDESVKNINKSGNYSTFTVTFKFEKANIDVNVVFNAEGKVSGINYKPSVAEVNYENAAMPKNIVEKAVTVGSGKWALPGTLTMPAGKGKFPAVILVHGSGPEDRDETLNGNKPFRDIAWGLASKGIAVLRYDKRTKVYGKEMASLGTDLTVKEEATDDVLKAYELLGTVKNIYKNKIYIAGHSEGGMLIPRIALETKGAAGYIMLAANARKLEDLYLEQVQYLMSDDNTMTELQKQAYIYETKQAVSEIKALIRAKSSSNPNILGAPLTYWKDLEAYDQVNTAKKIDKPLLVLQGEGDYQVTMKDFSLWKEGLAGKKNVTFKSYGDLNHLFISGKGKSTPQEYNVPGHVSQKVISDMANWILGTIKK